MEDLFELSDTPTELSDTVYSEACTAIQQARTQGSGKTLVAQYLEAFILLSDVGMLKGPGPGDPEEYDSLLWHCHLDAQVTENGETNENTTK